jgi:hypothetical protein
MQTGLPPLSEGPYATVEQKPVLDTMDTEAQLVRSWSVLNRLKTVPGFHVSPQQLAGRVTVTASANSRVLTIAVRADRPGNARAGARVLAKTYIKLRSRVIGQFQVHNRQAINRRVVILEAELKSLPSDPDTLARITVRTRRQALLRQILDARKQLAFPDQFVQVLRAPDRPDRTDDPGSAVNRTSGAGIGLLSGLLGGVVRERRPRRLRHPRDVRRRIPLPVLAEVGREGVSDAGRRLRNLAFAEDARTVLVSGMPGGAADPVAVSVAAAFAHGGAPTTLLRVDAKAVPAPQRDDAGLRPFRVETLSADKGDRGLADAVGRAHHGAGVVVISGPSLAGAEALTLAAIADLTFATVALGQVTDRPLTAAIDQLDKAGARPRGIVIT